MDTSPPQPRVIAAARYLKDPAQHFDVALLAIGLDELIHTTNLPSTELRAHLLSSAPMKLAASRVHRILGSPNSFDSLIGTSAVTDANLLLTLANSRFIYPRASLGTAAGSPASLLSYLGMKGITNTQLTRRARENPPLSAYSRYPKPLSVLNPLTLTWNDTGGSPQGGGPGALSRQEGRPGPRLRGRGVGTGQAIAGRGRTTWRAKTRVASHRSREIASSSYTRSAFDPDLRAIPAATEVKPLANLGPAPIRRSLGGHYFATSSSVRSRSICALRRSLSAV
jgi:hypothetical protein